MDTRDLNAHTRKVYFLHTFSQVYGTAGSERLRRELCLTWPVITVREESGRVQNRFLLPAVENKPKPCSVLSQYISTAPRPLTNNKIMKISYLKTKIEMSSNIETISNLLLYLRTSVRTGSILARFKF